MSSPAPTPAPNGAKPDPLASLISRIPDLQNRESYAALVSYIQSLPPTDELVKVAQLFGFLTLMGQQLPDAISTAQKKAIEALSGAYAELQQEIRINETLHHQLHQRLSKLPDEITAGVKPAAIAKAMSESFRQQIVATGIQDTSRFLTDATGNLKAVAANLDAVIQPVVERYSRIGTDIERKVDAIDLASNRMMRNAHNVDLENQKLLERFRQWEWWMLPALAVFCLGIGAFAEAEWGQSRVSTDIENLQEKVNQLQQTIIALPAAIAPPPRKPEPGKLHRVKHRPVKQADAPAEPEP